MSEIASHITSLTIVYSIVYSDADQRKHQSSASLAFVRGIHRGPVNSPHKWPVTRKRFPFDDVFMNILFHRNKCSSPQTLMCAEKLQYLAVICVHYKRVTLPWGREVGELGEARLAWTGIVMLYKQVYRSALCWYYANYRWSVRFFVYCKRELATDVFFCLCRAHEMNRITYWRLGQDIYARA